MGVLDFLMQAREAGRNARSDLEGGINYYIPPELRGLLGLAAEANPVVSMERAGQDAQRLVAPGMSGWDRMAAAGDMASNMAGVLAPVAGAGRAGVPVANAIQDVLVGASRSPAASGVMDFAADEFGGVGFKAYHGSPHDFDKFSMDKIGTGEGAQAYGHGLYFADSEGVAKSYRDKLAPMNTNVNSALRDANGDYDAAIAEAQRRIALYEKMEPSRTVDGLLSINRTKLEELLSQKAGNAPNPGSMYEVQINADPNDFLDWDRPFASADDLERFAARFDGVDPVLRKRIEDYGYVRQQQGGPMPDGNDLLREVFGGVGEKASVRATEMMREAGIPGIKYLDAGSRTAGDGSRNYVVFDDSMIEILRKYGLLAPALGAGAWASGSPTTAQAASGGLLEDRR